LKSPNSPNPVPPGWAAIARLTRPRGNRGELAAESWSSQPERFDDLEAVTLFPLARELAVESVWWHGDHPVFAFTGVESISDAEAFSNQIVCVALAERITLAEGEVFYGDLIGCEVFDTHSGQRLGQITDYQETAGPLLLEMGPHLIPFVPALCPKVDTAAKRIEVDLPEGFLDMNAK
jgi:16S rRNA processing protein RimM